MTLRSLILVCASFGIVSAADPGLLRVRNLYVLPMGSGLDQYLAGQLAKNGRFVVVTDPNLADAVLTDRVGTYFEEQFRELYPPPAPPEPEKAAVNPGDKPSDKPERSMVSLLGDASSGRSRGGNFSRGKGNIFMVERTSKRVLWSTYLRARNSGSDELNRVADNIVDRIESDASHAEKRLAKAAPAVLAPLAPAPLAPVPLAPAPTAPAPPPAPAK